MSDDLAVAGLVASRICHDLISPVGAIGNGIELLGPAVKGDDVLELIADCAGAASGALRFLRLAFGARDPEETISLSDLAAAAEAHFGRRKLVLDWAEAPATMRLGMAKPVLLLALAAASALPRGGTLRLVRAAAAPLSLEWRAEGAAAPSERLRALFATRPAAAETAPGEAHLLLLWLAAEAAGAKPWLRAEGAAFGVSLKADSTRRCGFGNIAAGGSAMHAYSMLDLAPVPEGATVADALRNSLDLARHAEALGYRRFWLAEHHNMPGIASAATAVAIGHVAAGTKTIRVGAGGVMLPNHAPLVIAEQFGTLEALFPRRIDLGLGRAPGTDMATARALRRHLSGPEDFPADVQELIGYLSAPEAGSRIRAVPGEGSRVPVWILGSSLYGAQLAAHFGLPYAFASHFAPFQLEEALSAYRALFRPSPHLAKPCAIMAVGIAAAATDEEARFLRSSQILGFANLRMGRPGPLPRPVEDLSAHLPADAIAQAEAAFSCSAVGAPGTVRRRLAELRDRFRPDEIMVTGMIHDHAARLRSFTIAAEALAGLVEGAEAA